MCACNVGRLEYKMAEEKLGKERISIVFVLKYTGVSCLQYGESSWKRES